MTKNKNTKIGFLLPHFGDNELAKAFVKSANTFLDNNSGVDIIGFVDDQVRPASHPIFASMNINEAFDYDGVVIATNLAMAEKLVKFPGPSKRYYYLWELNWGDGRRTFEELSALFHNPKITFVARTPEDKNVIEQCWNCHVTGVVPECDVASFVELIKFNDKN